MVYRLPFYAKKVGRKIAFTVTPSIEAGTIKKCFRAVTRNPPPSQDKKELPHFETAPSEFIMSQRLSGLGELKRLKEIIDLLLVTLAAVDGINLDINILVYINTAVDVGILIHIAVAENKRKI